MIQPYQQKRIYNLLTDENITDQDYTHDQNVWSTFGLKSTGEYHALYLKSDV